MSIYEVKKVNPAFERTMEEQRELARLAEQAAKEQAIKRFSIDERMHQKLLPPNWTQETFEKRKRRKKLADTSRARNRRR